MCYCQSCGITNTNSLAIDTSSEQMLQAAACLLKPPYYKAFSKFNPFACVFHGTIFVVAI